MYACTITYVCNRMYVIRPCPQSSLCDSQPSLGIPNCGCWKAEIDRQSDLVGSARLSWQRQQTPQPTTAYDSLPHPFPGQSSMTFEMICETVSMFVCIYRGFMFHDEKCLYVFCVQGTFLTSSVHIGIGLKSMRFQHVQGPKGIQLA